MNLVIQSFGKQHEYRRAILTIYSFYAHYGWPSAARVILFTDDAAFFKPYLEPFAVDYIFLSPEKIKSMRGEIDFLHRMKIVVIDEAMQISQDDILYVDSDTFFIADPRSIEKRIAPGTAFMHLKEYDFESLKDKPLPAGKTFRAFYELLRGNRFDLVDKKGITIPTTAISWNAGVMAFHHSHRALLNDVYLLTDQFYPPTSNHASEQYAFSIVLQQRLNVQACDDVVYHYWYRIEKQIADLWTAQHINDAWRAKHLSQRLKEIKEMTMLFPSLFQDHILMLQDRAIQAFNEDDFKAGRRWALRAWLRKPGDIRFLRDVLYHMRRNVKGMR
jgi:hypothetical protein